MNTTPRHIRLWRVSLNLALTGTVLFAAVLVLWPDLTRGGFSWMIYGDPQRLSQLQADVQAYIDLVHRILGATILGWASLLLLLSMRGPQGSQQHPWGMMLLSLFLWFIPDTWVSIVTGFWQNAVFNSVFLLILGAPLGLLFWS